MKKTFVVWIVLQTSITGIAQMPAEQQQAIVLKRMIERNHYSPRAVNDSLSSDVFNKVMKSLDPSHLIFTADEVAQLSSYRYKIDDELQGSGWSFFNQLAKSYTQAAKRADSLVNAVSQKPLDFSTAEKVMFSNQTNEKFPANTSELKNGWTKYFKYHLLNAAYDLSLSQTPTMNLKDALAKHEASLRQKILRSTRQRYELQIEPAHMREQVWEKFLVAISQCFDPHTMYFSPQQNDQFKTSLSKQDESYGFLIGEKDGKAIIQHLLPGGSAWRSGEVHRDDQLLQLNFEGKESVDVSLIDPEDVEDLLAESTSRTVTIKIKKADGNIKIVKLKKEKIESEENRVKGYVLEGSKKVGYISLPDFYTSWEDGAGSSCAEDVAKEIVNLKKEGIAGLIIDIRYNGGGSMQEAVEMIGIFINDGPVFAAKDKTKATFLKDPNRGTIWDGPLAIMINGQSASASESLAGSLQDYKRAVVVGSPSFGKATMQQIFPMDTTTSSRLVRSPLGFAKITVGKLYRLDGNTAQLKGVHPDVVLPDAFEVVEWREKNLANALPSDVIPGNSYYKPLPSLPVEELSQSSKARLAANTAFADVKKDIQKMAALYQSNQEVSLQPALFQTWREKYDALSTTGEIKNTVSTAGFAVMNHQYEKKRLQNNVYADDVNRVLLEQLQKDIYIEETYRIVVDLIQKNKL